MKFRVDVRVLKGTAAILAAVLVLLAGMLLLQRWENTQDAPVFSSGEASSVEADVPVDGREITYYNGTAYARREDLETVLLLGVDKFEGETPDGYVNNQQADFLLLLVMDKQNETCTPIQLNRDTMTQIQILGVTGEPAGTFTGQLALAHTYGSGEEDSCENTVLAVENLLYGVGIDHYVSLTMDGVALLNDLVGGVTVEVLDDFSAIDDSLVQGETVTLQGQRALTYVRSRGGMEDSSNLHRMERQRQYLSALQQQLKAAVQQEDGFTLDALLQLNEYMVSDCTVDQLSDLGDSLAAYQVSDILTTPGDAQEGEEFMEFTVDEDALQQLVMDVFYEPVEES
ncbi:putative membrane-bound protein LytR [Firmicutes bacterium CAG:94]|nr:putative membrane-bound protein LytR [Firmicutes bacterium CAG:94]